jgi:hypothetical protein
VSNFADSFTPVTGSNRPRRFHIPSGSTQVDNRVLRRCRSRRSIPSSASKRFASISRRRRNSSTVPAAATATNASARSNNSSRCAGSSCFELRVTASMCPAVIAPSPNASANFGVAANVSDRSVVLLAAPIELRSAAAIAASGNDDTTRNRPTNTPLRASNHPDNSRTATNAACTESASAAGSSHAASTRPTRSITPLRSIPPS